MVDPPARLLKQISNNPSAADFRGSFEHTRDTVRDTLARAGFDFADFERTLDFGCGVGRFLFAMQPALREGQQLLGCDVDAECARWCRENIDFARVEHTGLYPPLPFESGSIDLVYALSVFTHLRLELQFRWAWELHRVLSPGGVLFFTTHGPCYMEAMLAQARKDPRTRLDFAVLGDAGIFLNKTTRQGDAAEGQREVAVVHDRAAVDLIFAPFERRLYRPRSSMAASQDLHVLQKPADARPIALPVEGEPGLALSSEIGKRAETGTPMELHFELAGQRRFAALARLPQRGTYQVAFDLSVSDEASGGLLAEQRLHYNETEVFGDCFHFPMCLELPAAHEGRVVVRILPVLVQRHLLPERESVAVCCELAHFA